MFTYNKPLLYPPKDECLRLRVLVTIELIRCDSYSRACLVPTSSSELVLSLTSSFLLVANSAVPIMVFHTTASDLPALHVERTRYNAVYSSGLTPASCDNAYSKTSRLSTLQMISSRYYRIRFPFDHVLSIRHLRVAYCLEEEVFVRDVTFQRKPFLESVKAAVTSSHRSLSLGLLMQLTHICSSIELKRFQLLCYPGIAWRLRICYESL